MKWIKGLFCTHELKTPTNYITDIMFNSRVTSTMLSYNFYECSCFVLKQCNFIGLTNIKCILRILFCNKLTHIWPVPLLYFNLNLLLP